MVTTGNISSSGKWRTSMRDVSVKIPGHANLSGSKAVNLTYSLASAVMPCLVLSSCVKFDLIISLFRA